LFAKLRDHARFRLLHKKFVVGGNPDIHIGFAFVQFGDDLIPFANNVDGTTRLSALARKHKALHFAFAVTHGW
jgi:hypothetical protein